MPDLEQITEGVFQEKGELAQAFDRLDNDSMNSDGASAIDFNSNIKEFQAPLLTSIDILERMGVFPKGLNLTRTVKRVSVGINARGRDDKVNIARGEREQQSGGGFMDRIKGLVTRQ